MNYQSFKNIIYFFSSGIKSASHSDNLFAIKAKQFSNNKMYKLNSFPRETEELHKLLTKSEKEYQKQEYRYSLFWSRIVLEKSLKHITYKNDEEFFNDSIYKNLKDIENINIFSDNYLYHLHMTRKICNRNDHEIENEYGGIGAYYVIKQLKVLLAYIDENIYSQSSSKDLAYE